MHTYGLEVILTSLAIAWFSHIFICLVACYVKGLRPYVKRNYIEGPSQEDEMESGDSHPNGSEAQKTNDQKNVSERRRVAAYDRSFALMEVYSRTLIFTQINCVSIDDCRAGGGRCGRRQSSSSSSGALFCSWYHTSTSISSEVCQYR